MKFFVENFSKVNALRDQYVINSIWFNMELSQKRTSQMTNVLYPAHRSHNLSKAFFGVIRIDAKRIIKIFITITHHHSKKRTTDFKEMQNAFILLDSIDKCSTFKNVEMLSAFFLSSMSAQNIWYPLLRFKPAKILLLFS